MSTQTDLDEAIAARHKLLTGAASASVRFADGRAVVYQATNLAALEKYIASLRRTIAGTTRGRSSIIYPVFD